MAEVVKELPADGRRTWGYPWDRWTDGQVWRVKQGVDFKVSHHDFRSVLSVTAKRRGLKVSTRIRSDGVYFQFRERTPDEMLELEETDTSK